LILPYCIVAEASIKAPATGVRDTPVDEMDEDGLRCFYSRFERQPKSFRKEDVLQFHSTVQALFQHVAVIPFRFPTIVQSEQELRQFLQEKSAAYHATFEKLRNLVQMEVRIVNAAEYPVGGAPSGKEYLQRRLAGKREKELGVASVQRVVEDLCLDWRQRETRDAVRGYALVLRENIGHFRKKIEAFSPPQNVRLFVSGPWPATEFIE
jgi:Gas vesicle synthesis protein GvpL/GvpF